MEGLHGKKEYVNKEESKRMYVPIKYLKVRGRSAVWSSSFGITVEETDELSFSDIFIELLQENTYPTYFSSKLYTGFKGSVERN